MTEFILALITIFALLAAGYALGVWTERESFTSVLVKQETRCRSEKQRRLLLKVLTKLQRRSL